MKTKKGLLRQTGQLVAFVAIVLCSFTLSACGDDDDDDITAQSIVGKWILEKGEYAMTNPITGEVVRELIIGVRMVDKFTIILMKKVFAPIQKQILIMDRD